MAPVRSTGFVTVFQRISAFLSWFSLLAWVEAQQSVEVSILRSWSQGISPSPLSYIPVGYVSTWNFNDMNPCAWVGVRCTANLTVEELDLSGWGLPELSLSSLSGLKDLRYLDLSSSDLITFDRELGEEVGTLTGLTHLDISNSGLQGKIPANISNCTSLRYLSLEQNHLSGAIPSLSSLVNLQVLRLAGNNLDGSFPKNLSRLSSLVSIDFSDNNLSGTIPSLSSFPNLVELNLDNNFFQAFEEPLSSGNNSLQRLLVSGNQLGVMISPNITNLLDLQVLDLSNNSFVGGIPSGFAGLWNRSLISVDLSLNNLSGKVPDDFLRPCTNVIRCPESPVIINVSNNLLSDSLPLDDSQFVYGSVVDLSHNQFSGSVPLMLNGFEGQGIFSLWLQNNQLSGDLVDLLVQAAPKPIGMNELHLENNYFTGDLSRMIGNWIDLGIPIVGLSNNYLQLTTSETILDPLGATLQDFAGITYYGDQLGIQLHLSGNNFSGASLPTACFGQSTFGNYFQVLDLSNNSLDGEILGEVFNETCLPQLQSLNLSNNRIHGRVPQSIFLPNLTVLDVSRNNLSGHLPFIQTSSPLYNPRIFANNIGLCGDPLPPCPFNNTQPVHGTGAEWWVLLIIVAFSVMGFVGSCIIATWRWRVYQARHQQDADLIKTLMGREAATLMPLRELKKATQNFAESAQIGEGGFGTVYKGRLNDGTMVAIKRSKREGSEKDKEQFLNEVRILSQVNHRFLVKLLGCCLEDKIALLVFEFVPNGTLQDHLQGNVGNRHLTWKQRLNIAVQTANALNYLHSATTIPIYHRDVKSANILLDNDFNAKVADFGISKLAPVRATHVSTIAVQGTIGYIDPEYYTSYQLTDRSDVYSFGVVLLELISAKLVIDFSRGGEETSLVYFIRPHIEKADLEPVIDPTLMNTYVDPAGCGRDSILNVGRLAMNCLDRRSKTRPRMNEVWKQLQDLWLEFTGTTEHLISIKEDDGEAAQRDHVWLLSKSLSGDSAKFSVQSDADSIQLSRFAFKLNEQGFLQVAQDSD